MPDLYARWLPPTDDLTELRKARVVVGASYVLLAVGGSLTVVYVALAAWMVALLNVLALGGAAAALPLLRRRGPVAATHAAAFGAWLCLVPSFIISGGIEARFLLWLAMLPLFAGLLGGVRAGQIWGLVGYLSALGFVVAHALGIEMPQWVPQDGPPLLWALQYLMFFAAIVGFTSVFLQNQRWAEVRWERSRQALAAEVEGRARAEQEAASRRAHEVELAAFTAELERARDDAVAANEAKSRFLANMSHELRTPLNAILGYTEMVAEELDPVEQAEAVEDLERVVGAGRHLLDLIRDVLDLSKIEAGRMDVSSEDVDLHEVIADVVHTVEPLARKGGNRLEIDVPPDLPTLWTDGLRLQQILVNLLGNACKFTIDGEVRLEARVAAGTVVFVVRDTGIGMGPEQLATLFQAFHQGDPSTTRRFGGSGLGLAISQHFAHLLGGEIVAESLQGVGSTFRLLVPVIEPPAASDAPTADAARRPAG